MYKGCTHIFLCGVNFQNRFLMWMVVRQTGFAGDTYLQIVIGTLVIFQPREGNILIEWFSIR